MIKGLISIIKHDSPNYARSTLLFTAIALIILTAAMLIDRENSGSTSMTEDVLNIVSPDPLRFLIGAYAASLGFMALFGDRLSSKVKFPKVINVGKYIFEKIAYFCKETTFIFCGFLIACGLILVYRNLGFSGLLAVHLTLVAVMFFIYGFFDYLYKNFQILEIDNKFMIVLQELLVGMIFIGMAFAVLLLNF